MFYFFYNQYLVNNKEANDFYKENQIFKMIYPHVNTFRACVCFAEKPKEIMPKWRVIYF